MTGSGFVPDIDTDEANHVLTCRHTGRCYSVSGDYCAIGAACEVLDKRCQSHWDLNACGLECSRCGAAVNG